MRRVVAVVPDLLFLTRIAGTARAAGIELIPVAAGDAAAARCAAEPPDLIVLDLTGPGALPLAAALRDDPRTAAVPVVGFYPHVDQELRERAVAAGVGRALPRSAFVRGLAAILSGTG